MSASSVSKIKPSYLALLDMTRMEFMTNRDNYTEYFYDGADITTEVEKFIKEKSYCRQIGDMMCNALANATLVSAIIWVKEDDGSLIQSAFVTPTRGLSLNGVIHILKDGQHFEPIVGSSTAGFILLSFSIFSRLRLHCL